jgi:hypothetical protein
MRAKLVATIVAALLLWLSVGALAQAKRKGTCQTWVTCSEKEVPTYRCAKASASITVDGRLTEAAWSRAEVFREFRLTNGEALPTYPTEFRALWDAKSLYLSFVCTDPEIIAKLTKRDATVYEDDCVEAFLCPSGDLTRYYEFEFNPLNTQMDASVVFAREPFGGDKTVDYGWNCQGLKTATRVEGKGEKQRWSIEIALPFSQLGREHRAPAVKEEWRANFYRIEYGTEPAEFSCWSPTVLPSFHTPARFGRIAFVSALPGQKGR